MMNNALSAFSRVSELLSEPVLLVSTDGRIRDLNQPATRLLGKSAQDARNIDLSTLTAGSTDKTRSFLRNCAASRQPVIGRLKFNLQGAENDYRCEGAALEPGAPGKAGLLFLRLLPHQDATQRFRILTERIDSLGREVETRLRAEQYLDGQREILEQIAKDAPLDKILSSLVRFIEDRSHSNARASVLLLDSKTATLVHGAAPSLPPEYCNAIDGIEIGPAVGACGTAAFLNEPVCSEDIASDPKWNGFDQVALQSGLHACFSTPITGTNNEVLGTFAVYYPRVQKPDIEDQRLIDLMTRSASIAIARQKATYEIRELLERERLSRKAAEEANRSKDEFLAMVSHELRNPLNAILGWAKVLTMRAPDQKTLDDGLAAIERNASLQADLIKEILDYSRIKAGKLSLDKQPSDIEDLVRAAVASAKPVAGERQIRLDFSSTADLPDNVLIDPARLQQVVNNIISNALKFTAPGGKVDVALSNTDSTVQIRISDTGCGIDKAFLPFVFERFQQQDSSKKRHHEGLGLGLAIVRQIVEMHGGEVFAASDGPECGSVFTILLPRLHKVAEKNKPEVCQTRLNGLKILAVDDAMDTRSLLKTLLGNAGASVTVAANGNEALDFIESDPPELILCDVGMPGMDGYEVMRRLRAIEKASQRPAVPAIALTAYARRQDIKLALKAGFDAHMAKPIDPSELLKAIAKLDVRAESPIS